ncbi:sel1 repeat family protein [Actinocorallia populi]|uniref:sel1 repeat family protein n=1 Tax=Actinocorallia populi TaxID=2079200 RepID=UPI000D08A095|nr:sel1 repeat family protein [Actinocorallia populi]
MERKQGKEAAKAIRGLPKGTLQPVLTHQRRVPPKWDLVSSFVRACRRYCLQSPDAQLTGLGERTIAEWAQLWKEVFRVTEETLEGTAEPWGEVGEDVSAFEETMVLSAPDSEETSPPEPSGPSWEGGLSLSEERFSMLYGEPGLRLFRKAEGGDGEECRRLGVLLIVDEYLVEGREWVRKARLLGDEHARVLLEQEDLHGAAVELAVRLGRAECGLAITAAEEFKPLSARHHGERAELYLQPAAYRGRADAAWLMAHNALGRDDYHSAHWWFLKAMHLDYGGDGRLAEEWVHRTHQVLLSNAPADPQNTSRPLLPSLEELCEKASKDIYNIEDDV